MNDTSYTDLINEVIELFYADQDTLIFIAVVAGVCLLIGYYLPKIVFAAYEANAMPEIQQVIIEMIYKLDEFADEMSNKEKREKVVDKMHKLIRFGNYALPKSICGLIVDIQVSRIRALQKSCSVDSDLHKDDE